jgi:hypothetical protein
MADRWISALVKEGNDSEYNGGAGVPYFVLDELLIIRGVSTVSQSAPLGLEPNQGFDAVFGAASTPSATRLIS